MTRVALYVAVFTMVLVGVFCLGVGWHVGYEQGQLSAHRESK